jgi:hypothetical protein
MRLRWTGCSPPSPGRACPAEIAPWRLTGQKSFLCEVYRVDWSGHSLRLRAGEQFTLDDLWANDA